MWYCGTGVVGVDTIVAAITTDGSRILLGWDSTSCQADDYNLIFGNLEEVSTFALQGSKCGIGLSGEYDWRTAPAGDLFLLIVGVDDTGVYESSWGTDGSGTERNGTAPSNTCDVTTKDATETCP